MGTCGRCGGLMVRVLPLAVFTGELDEEPAASCVNCGECVDATILRNRAAMASVPLMEVAA